MGLIQFSAAAQTTAIDLNDFYANPTAAVMIAPDGASAVMAEEELEQGWPNGRLAVKASAVIAVAAQMLLVQSKIQSETSIRGTL